MTRREEFNIARELCLQTLSGVASLDTLHHRWHYVYDVDHFLSYVWEDLEDSIEHQPQQWILTLDSALLAYPEISDDNLILVRNMISQKTTPLEKIQSEIESQFEKNI